MNFLATIFRFTISYRAQKHVKVFRAICQVCHLSLFKIQTSEITSHLLKLLEYKKEILSQVPSQHPSISLVSLGCLARWHVPSRSSLRTLLPPISVAETAFVGNQGAVVPTPGNGDRPELSEAECDIDSLKKLKLGLRSSLWSRPSTQNNPSSDYSIAV